MHRDSMGTVVEIKPGAVNWMTAGKGIVHSERTPDYLRHSDKSMHGLQIWVALPKGLEQMDPGFAHIEAANLPTWMDGDLQYKLVAGEALGLKSPVPVYSPLYMLELKSTTSRHIDFGHKLYGEAGLYILEGAIESDGHTFGPRQLLVATESTLCNFTLAENSTIYIFGGEPFAEERLIDWNFVASDRQLIDVAKANWHAQTFPKIPDDDIEFVPYPTIGKK